MSVNGVLNQYLKNYVNVDKKVWGKHFRLDKILLQLHNALSDQDVLV